MRRWAPAEFHHAEHAASGASGYGPARSSRWQKKEPEVVEFAGADSSQNVWYFGFGANINPWKLRTKRKIEPLEQVAGRLLGWRLTFNHKGGMGNIEPLNSSTLTNAGPDEVHGMLLYITPKDFKTLCKIEFEYGTTDVQVTAYDGRQIVAKAFVTPPNFKLVQSLPPPERYLNLIKDGCETMGIDPSYRSWLESLQTEKGQRGGHYWSVGQQKPQSETSGYAAANMRSRSSRSEGPLRLAALMEFAIPGDNGLVDIGANLGRCSPEDLASQLVRAAAAGVTKVVLTGCNVKGSVKAKHLTELWSGGPGWEKTLQHLGAAARKEIHEMKLTSLPQLRFTAGVHPHDSKTCDENTMKELRDLAASPGCVSIGECGLDYDRMHSPLRLQLEWCRKQVELAVELGMPLFLHERDRDPSKGQKMGSSENLRDILAENKVDPKKVCIHCFTGNREELSHYISQGYFIGLTGFAAMKRQIVPS